MNPKVMKLLRQYTEEEKIQLKENKLADNIPDNVKEFENNSFTILKSYFYDNKDIYISKHNRFAPYPLHSHEFVEINYMVTGKCKQIIDGEEITLNTGDLVFLDIGCKHSLYALSDEDILINILFSDQSINIEWLNDMKKSNNLMYDFLLNISSGVNNPRKFIVYRHNNESDIKMIIEKIIEEYYLKKPFSSTIISNYMSILFTELVRNYDIKSDENITPQQTLMINILKDIEEQFKDITLEKIAIKYGYNKNYLSNLIKKETGLTFSELVLKQRMMNAHLLITTTTMPISDIIYAVGLSNKYFFYKKYKEFYNCLPSENRKN